MTIRNLVLVGFMGTGKSTIGKRLAERLGWAFIDTDALIEQQQSMTISEMFRVHGEAFFRSVESRTIDEVLAGEGQVLATGGGAVLAEANRSSMLRNGYVVALKASAEVIIKRVAEDQGRPLLQGDLKERVNTLMKQRKHAYDFAHLIIDTSALDVDPIVELILEETRRKG